ncbi:hypothetical protein [Phaeobacter porticola]|uniref:Glycosyl transferase family 8 n=1 Tax=Phaeobacter porticola TaxID=1844006 RepID=A0A1L3I6Z4_9RHOB|nr:hypothetical protein [Phaeobacter porticola]APG47811.1 hypothetical protein PhaeoP97_02426 [Phaeobacter porticola]
MANTPFNIMIVGQAGRLQFEAVLFAASLRHYAPSFTGRLYVAEPQPGANWEKDPSIHNKAVLETLRDLKAEILPFQSHAFGQSYPYGNKIEALLAMPAGEPFVFFDTDTLITGPIDQVPFDFARPSASLRREGTWPKPTLYGPDMTEIWRALYDRFGLNFDSSLDLNQPKNYWQRYLYFNAGYFYGTCPHVFGTRFLSYATSIRDDLPRALVGQSLDPWLDQIALPLVVHSLGGGRNTLPHGYLDGVTSCHYRNFPLLYARESDAVVTALETVARPNKIKKVLKLYEPMKRMIYQGRGAKVRAMFDRNNLPRKEQALRNRIKSAGYWLR